MYPKSIPNNYSNEINLNICLYEFRNFNYKINKEILRATIKFIKRSERIYLS